MIRDILSRFLADNSYSIWKAEKDIKDLILKCLDVSPEKTQENIKTLFEKPKINPNFMNCPLYRR